jgi:hypothetical protein
MSTLPSSLQRLYPFHTKADLKQTIEMLCLLQAFYDIMWGLLWYNFHYFHHDGCSQFIHWLNDGG